MTENNRGGRLPGLADCHWVDGVGRARLLGAVAPCSVGGEAVMTTHDRDKIIAAAIGCIEGPYDRSRAITITGNEIERLYAIAYEDGRQADKADAERYRWLCEQNEKGVGFFHLAFAARNIMNWKTKTEIDDGIDRARGDMK